MKKALSLILSLMLVFTMLPAAFVVQATEYSVLNTLTDADFSTTMSRYAGSTFPDFRGGGYYLEFRDFTDGSILEKSAVSSSVSDGLTSEKVFYAEGGAASSIIRFKGFSAVATGQQFRIKCRVYIAESSSSADTTFAVNAQAQKNLTTSAGGSVVSNVATATVGQWCDVTAILVPTSNRQAQGFKLIFAGSNGAYPTKVYFDGNIVVETVQEVAQKTPDELLSEDKEALDLGDTSAVTENITLPTSGANGSAITWATTDAAVIEADGTVHRDTEDKSAILIATLSLDGATSDTKEFTVTVKAEETQSDGPVYETTAVLTGGNDFSTVFSGSGTQLTGSGYTLQNVSSSFTSMAVEAKSAVAQDVAAGVTSVNVLTLTPAEDATPVARFKGFSQTTVGDPIKIKFKIYLASASDSDTYTIKVQPQVGTSAQSAGGAFDITNVSANQWIEVDQITTPTNESASRGLKFTVNKSSATTFPTTIYMDGNIVVEQLSEVIVKTPDELLSEDKEALDLGDTSAVTENITLPTSGANGTAITWATSDAAVVEANGTVHRAEEDKSATLTATLTLDGATSDTKEFTVTVKAQPQQEADAQEKVSADKEALDLGDTSALTENITLPTSGENGSAITWATSDAAVIEADGTIHRAVDDKSATLTATITFGNISETKTFPVTVKADTERFQVEWNTIFEENFLTWTRYDQNTATKVTYPARYGASSKNRMEFKYNGEETQGTYPDLVYDVSSVSKTVMTTAHPATASGATGSGNYAKIYRESRVGALFFKLNAPTSIAVGDKVRTTFRIFPTDICLTGKTTEGDLAYDELDTVQSITYTVTNNYASSTTATKTGGYSKEINLIPNQWNTVTLDYTATVAGVGGFQFNIGGANYNPDTYTTPFPATIYIDGDVKIEQGVVTEVVVLTPTEKVALDKAALDLGDVSAVVNSLTLPVSGENGSVITWTTSNPDVVENNGTIHRGVTAQSATLTATITNGSASDIKTFTVTVAGEESAAEKVALDKAALDLGDVSALINNLTLPTVGSERNSTITWATSDASIITAGGVITRAADNKTATLTATIKNGNASDTKEIIVTVKGTVERRTLQGVNGTYFYGGEFVETDRIYFSSLFESDGSNGTNGTQTFTPDENATEDKKKYIGLVASTTEENGIKFNGWVPDSYTGVNKLLLSKTYDLPEMEDPAQPYYIELEVDSQTRGVVKYNFGNSNGNVLSIQKTDSRVQVNGTWKDDLEQEDYVFSIGGVEKARTDVVRKEVTKFGIYVIPETKKIAIYQDGVLLVNEVFDYTGEDTVLKDVTVTWNQSRGSSGIPVSSYLHLRSMALFEGPALSVADCLALDKEYFSFSIATDEPFDAITENLTLPATAVFGSEVRWSSSDSSLLDATTGAITRDEFLNKDVTLYAHIGPEESSVTKSVVLTLLATTPSVRLDGIDNTYFYDNTFYQKEQIVFGDSFEDSTVNSDGWAANGSNGTVYVAPITTEGATVGERTPGLYAKKTEQNGIWYQSLVASAENNGQGLPIFEKTYTLPEITNNGLPYYIELDAEMYIRDSLTLSFGNKDNGIVEIEKLDQNEHADHPDGKNIFVIRTNNIEREAFPYSYSSNTEISAVKIGIQVIPELKQVLIYKNGELMYTQPLDFSKKSSPIKTLTIKWEHSTVRTTLMQANYLHLKTLTLYEGGPLPASDRLALDEMALLLSSFTNETAEQITKNLTLPSKGVYDCDITWAVENGKEHVINPQTGEVTRQDTAEEVVLTATISVEGQFLTKSFTLNVVRKGTEGSIVSGSDVTFEKTSTIEDPSFITDGIFETYVETLTAGAKPKITIDLGEENLISQIIIYERMLNGQYNIKRANLDVSKDGQTWTRVGVLESGIGEKKVVEFTPQSVRYITLTVTNVDSDKTVSLYEIEAVMSAEDSAIVDADISVLKAFENYNVTESTTLPTTGQLGSVITWTSSDESVVDSSGNVTRPSGAGKNVTLTATVTFGTVTKTVSFSHYVTGLASGGAGGGSGSGGSGGGGGGGSSSSGNDKVTGGGAMNEEPQEPETPVAPESGIFNDVDKDSWAYEYIEKLYTEKIMEGDGKGNFDPTRPIRREEFLKILLLALDVEIEENGDSVFDDVKDSDWYAPYVNTAYKLGITNGMGDGTFGVGQTISRQDMAVLSSRVAALQGAELAADGEKKLTDINSVSEYARESVQLLANAGIISGDEYAIFNPEGNALREQAAKIICLIMEQKAQ